ncbi:hypothetical protein [Methylobacterium radiotolerans]|uniref:hypothetical protein n=1 Tax=Methylobacterium radiotolerans TaxID=31998 RepID=UPI0038D1A76F
MLFFALLFVALAIVGACVGLGTIGQPMYGQALNSYGWALCINGAALATFFVLTLVRRLRRRAIGVNSRRPHNATKGEFYMRTPHLIVMAMLISVTSLSVLAQTVDQTGTGGGPATTMTAPYTATTGQTVPNPSVVNPSETSSIEQRSREEERMDAITRGICIGCSR